VTFGSHLDISLLFQEEKNINENDVDVQIKFKNAVINVICSANRNKNK